jgi:hypothetical protein
LISYSVWENNVDVRLAWPFKSRNGNRRNGGRRNGHDGNEDEQNGARGQACPDFLCVGAQKAGTSWLYQQLEAHPDFWMPPVKELHYLDELSRTKRFHPPRCGDERDAVFLESMKDLSTRFYLDLERYGRLFQHKGTRVSGDISPAYSTLRDEIIERVVNHFPNLKVVFLARDPVERAWSQLSMGVRLGMIHRFDATDPEEVICNLLNPGVLVAVASQQGRGALETLRPSGKLPRLFLRRLEGKAGGVASINSAFSGRRSREAKRTSKA